MSECPAEQLAQWYLRLNGFLTTTNFALHRPEHREQLSAEVDLLGVRFPNSKENMNGEMMDHQPLVALCDECRTAFVICEVKRGPLRINDSWSGGNAASNYRYVLQRLGYWENYEPVVDALRACRQWKDGTTTVRHIAIGDQNDSLADRALQITWDDVAEFLFDRFASFPKKGRPRQWPSIGRRFAKWIEGGGRQEDAGGFVRTIIAG